MDGKKMRYFWNRMADKLWTVKLSDGLSQRVYDSMQERSNGKKKKTFIWAF